MEKRSTKITEQRLSTVLAGTDGRSVGELQQSTSHQSLKENQSHNGQGKQHCEVLCLTKDSEAQGNLLRLLTDCFDSLKVYGKEPEQIDATVRMFLRVLGRFTWHEIERAFDVYLSTNSEMPAPADIVKIIEPPTEKRKWCGATYIQLCKERSQGQFMSDKELQYIRDYKQAAVTGEADAAAVSQSKVVNKQYLLGE